MPALSQEERRCKRERAQHTRRIRELNDAFRRTFTGGRVMLTAGFFLWREFPTPRRIATPAASRRARWNVGYLRRFTTPRGLHKLVDCHNDGADGRLHCS